MAAASKSSKPGTPSKAKRSAASTPKSTPSKNTSSKKKTPSKQATPASADGSINDTPASKYSSARSTPLKGTPTKASKKSTAKTVTPKKSTSLIKQIVKKDEKKAALVKDALLKKAISELVKFNERKEANSKEKDSKKKTTKLFDEDETSDHFQQSLDLSFTFKKFLSSKNQSKQKLIELPNSLYPNLEEFSICLIIRDNVIKSGEDLESIEEAKIPHLSKILPFKELYNEYKTFDQKRQLFKSYDLFIADEGIITNLPSILGKKFYDNHYKVPLPINVLSKTDLQKNKIKKFSIESVTNSINKIIKSTRYALQNSNNLSIPVGNVVLLNQSENLANLKTVLNTIVENYNDGKTNEVRSIFLKLRSSPALPLYEDDKLYLSSEENVKNDDDVKHEKKESEKDEKVIFDGEALDVKLSNFEKGLLELGQFESKPKFLETKVKRKLQKDKKNNGEATKPSEEEKEEEMEMEEEKKQPKKKKARKSKK